MKLELGIDYNMSLGYSLQLDPTSTLVLSNAQRYCLSSSCIVGWYWALGEDRVRAVPIEQGVDCKWVSIRLGEITIS